jgi:1-acyl-sn-glycerol-3-phosphate acyltransferase
MEAIIIDRSSGHIAVNKIVEQGTERLKKGRWVMIFPEGTRVAPGKKKHYGLGGAVLAEQSGFPIVPVVHNAGEFWPRRKLIKKLGVIHVRIGRIIDPKGRTAEEIITLTEQWIEQNHEEISRIKNR